MLKESVSRHCLLDTVYPAQRAAKHQRAPNPPEFAQPRLSRSNGGHPQREGTNLGVFVPIWLIFPRGEATNLGVFALGHFALISPCSNGAVQIQVGQGLELADNSVQRMTVKKHMGEGHKADLPRTFCGEMQRGIVF